MKTNKISSKDFRNWNEEMIKKYDQDLYYSDSPLPIRLIERLRIKKVIKMLSPLPSEKIVEVGCGIGNVIKEIKEGKIIGIDISFYLLEKAQDKLNTSVTLIEADAESIPLKTRSIDKVICTEVLEHVLHPEAVLAEIKRIMTNGASAVVSIPNENLINKLKKIFLSSKLLKDIFFGRTRYRFPEDMSEEWHIHIFDINTFKNMIPEGLKIKSIRAIPFKFLPIRYVIKLIKN